MSYRPKIGVALGSGGARGWAHIGALRALVDFGLEPTVVCGTSMGALVGAAYAAGHLDSFEEWARSLDRGTVLKLFDVSFRGGLIEAKRVFEDMSEHIPDVQIEHMEPKFGAVAADLDRGTEVWFQQGGLREALRASVAIPGLVSPARDPNRNRWLVDGGLVNPVPVSLCRALGADVVIAVELSGEVLAHPITQFTKSVPSLNPSLSEPGDRPTVSKTDSGQPEADDRGDEGSGPVRDQVDEKGSGDEEVGSATMFEALSDFTLKLRERIFGAPPAPVEPRPSVYEVMSKGIMVMQVRITRSAMAGDPPELHVVPRLQDVGILDFDKAAQAIPEGYRAVEIALAAQADFHRQSESEDRQELIRTNRALPASSPGTDVEGTSSTDSSAGATGDCSGED